MQNYQDNFKKQRDYTYVSREVTRKLDGKNNVKSTETKTNEVMQLYGERVSRLIEKDDKPLSGKDAAKEESRIQKLTDERKNESEDERSKREAKQEKEREESQQFVSEVPEAYNFRLVGSEIMNGRDSWVIAGEPRPDFRPHAKGAELLSKVRGRLWIDKSDLQLARIEIETIDTVSFGWVLARIRKGAHVEYDRVRVNDEVWMPAHYEVEGDARIAVFKNDNERDEGTFRDYKKFRTSSKIVGLGDVQQK